MSEIIGNRYQVTKLIGKGGMAEVYLAWDTILNREVAIKVLKSDMSDDDIALERFKREAGATTQLSHPNIVDVYDVGDDGDKHYIVMEYVKGYTLKQLIRKRGAIPHKEAVWIMKQLAGSLMEAHRKGIIHRDVKSQNVLIKPDGTIKLSDFGIALANGSMQITSKDSVLGSVHYLAPELTRGKQASMQSDIYSLGIVFYELLTGDVPFKAETPVQVALMHVKSEIPSVRKFNPLIPQSVENILIKATAKSLSNRYKNIALMLKDLNECLNPEHKNDSIVNLDNNKENGVKLTMQAADEIVNKEDKKKAPIFMIIIMSILSISAILIILFLSGIFGSKQKYALVPNVINMNIIEAKDILAENGLNIDEPRIEYELSQTIEKDKIISISPDVGQEVELNSKVKVVVSSGIASYIENYVGMNYLEAIKDLNNKNIKVIKKPIADSNKNGGEIIKQEPEPGEPYNPLSNDNKITLYYCSNDEMLMIDPSIQGLSVEAAINFFDTNGISYELIVKDKSFFSDTELYNQNTSEIYPAGVVIKTEPEIGTLISKNSENKVKIYYYQGE